MTSYVPSTGYSSAGSAITYTEIVLRRTDLDTSDEIFFQVAGQENRLFKFKISTSTWLDGHSNEHPHALSNGLTSTTPSSFGGDVSGTPQPAIIGICLSSGGSEFGGFANPFYPSSSASTSTAVASLGTSSGGVLKIFVPASSTGGSYSVFEGSTLRQVITHVVHSLDLVTITSWSMGNSSIWHVYFNGSIIHTWPTVIPSSSTTKKVHCNFW